MRFCIVSPPTVTEFSREVAQTDAILQLAEHAPVGVLTLAAVLQARRTPLEFVDLNSAYYDYIRSDQYGSPEMDFCRYAAERLLARPFDAIGFGTICSSYPLTLRIAGEVRRQRPDVPIILGGPQASATDLATLKAFGHIDYILRYEAEDSLPALLAALEAGTPVETVKGLTHRRHGEVVRTASAPPIENLDDVPVPAYELYPHIQEARYIPLELGRGCPYACTFCSTNDFFRRDFRLKSPAAIVGQMIALKKRYNVETFDLIHDMFTVNRKKVVEFCRAIVASGEQLYWNCSARTDRVDQELLELMAEAGCRGMFFGIETGSQALQRTLKKNLILTDAIRKIRWASDNGLQTAASLITGFPTETTQDFRDTSDFFVRALRYENAAPQLHILAPLADTPIEREYRARLAFDDIVSDMSHQGWDQGSADRDLIAAYPDVFSSFYAVPTGLDRRRIKEIRAFLLYGARRVRWMMVALHQEVAHIVDVFDGFAAWRAANGAPAGEGADSVSYYQKLEFAKDFTAYAKTLVSGLPNAAPALSAILQFSSAFNDLSPEAAPAKGAQGAKPVVKREAYAPHSVPVLARQVRLLRTEVDFRKTMEALVEGLPLADVPREASTLASRKPPNGDPEVIQLSPKSMALLQLCDGERNTETIIRTFSALFPRSDEIPPETAAMVGLELLRHDHLIGEREAPAA